MTDENQTQATNDAVHHSNKNWATLLALFVAILAAVLAGASCFHSYKIQQSLAANNDLLEQLKTSARINSLNLNTVLQKNRSLQTEVQRLVTQGSSSFAALNEAADLVRAAQMSMMLNNTAHASHYLELANQQVLRLNNPSYQTILVALNQNLNVIKAFPTVDQEALLIKLDGLDQSIAQLPTVFSPVKTTENPKMLNPSENPSENPYENFNWKRKIMASLAYLKSFIVVRHNSQLPVLTPEQQDLLKLMMRFKLLETQWAVIELQDSLYQHNLAIVSEGIQSYYQHSPEALAILEQVKALQQIHPQPHSLPLDSLFNLITAHLKEPASTENNVAVSSAITPQKMPKANTDNTKPPSSTTPPIHSSVEA